MKGSLVCLTSNFNRSESGQSQKGCRMSSSSVINQNKSILMARRQYLSYNIMQNQNTDVNRQEVEAVFAEMFEDPFNTVCYECGRKTKQWVETELAIFLCLTCAGLYKAACDQLNVKCLTADPFKSQELSYLKKGGNRKLKEFLSNYEMQELIYRERLQTQAVAYYRTLLREESNGRMPPMAPDIQSGKQFVRPVKKLTEMTPGQVFEELGKKAKTVGESALEYGGKAFSTIHQKISNVQLKEGVIQIGESISTKAKGLWQSLTHKSNPEPEKHQQ